VTLNIIKGKAEGMLNKHFAASKALKIEIKEEKPSPSFFKPIFWQITGI